MNGHQSPKGKKNRKESGCTFHLLSGEARTAGAALHVRVVPLRPADRATSLRSSLRVAWPLLAAYASRPRNGRETPGSHGLACCVAPNPRRTTPKEGSFLLVVLLERLGLDFGDERLLGVKLGIPAGNGSDV